MSRRGWALFAVVGVIWGIPDLLTKIAAPGVSAPVLVFAWVLTGSLQRNEPPLIPATRASPRTALCREPISGGKRWISDCTFPPLQTRRRPG